MRERERTDDVAFERAAPWRPPEPFVPRSQRELVAAAPPARRAADPADDTAPVRAPDPAPARAPEPVRPPTPVLARASVSASASAPPRVQLLRQKVFLAAAVAAAVMVAFSIGLVLGKDGVLSDAATNAPVTDVGANAADGATGTPAGAAHATQTVTYSCTGSAPHGVAISYGALGSGGTPEAQATGGSARDRGRATASALPAVAGHAARLPFSATETVDPDARALQVTARLTGGGTVSCSASVAFSSAGTMESISQSGEAAGTGATASAEVCADTSAGWRPC